MFYTFILLDYIANSSLVHLHAESNHASHAVQIDISEQDGPELDG